jgi:hypothetical protein
LTNNILKVFVQQQDPKYQSGFGGLAVFMTRQIFWVKTKLVVWTGPEKNRKIQIMVGIVST